MGASWLLLLLLCSIAAATHPIAFQAQPPLKSDANDGIKYEAENAFVSVRVDASRCQLGKIQFSGGAAQEIYPETYTIFSVNIPKDGFYPVSLSAYSCGTQGNTIDIYANGLPLLVGAVVDFGKTNTIVHNLQLRYGLNTIRYHVYGSSMVFDFISVKGGIPNAVRGATLTYEEIEAESAKFQGSVIGPDRTYTKLPSEASGRKAVQLTTSGNYVEFSPTKSFNGIVMRYSIPNSGDGRGQAANLALSVNGQQSVILNVTSFYSWTYGEYPFFRNPGAGNPHHFYDDVRYLFNATYPAGTKVRFTSAASLVITVDLCDFYTVPAPYTMPANYISVTDFGADPTGKKDSAMAFGQAFTAFTQKQPAGVWVPAGKYVLSYRLNMLNNLVVRGAGPWHTELTGHDFGFDGIQSKYAGLYDFALIGDTNVREDTEVSSGVGSALNYGQVQNLWIEHNKCGMWVDGPFTGLHTSGVTIRNTFADGINYHVGVTNSMVEQTIVRNTGDDSLAMWASIGFDDAPDAGYGNNVFRFNTLSIPILANTIAIYGGTNNSATDNYCADTVIEGAGLQTGTRFGSAHLAGGTYFGRNTLVRCGSPDMYNPVNVEGAIWLYADQDQIDTPITFEDIIIEDAYFQAIEFYKGVVSNINFTNIQVNGAKYLWDTLVQASIYAQGVVAKNITTASVNNCNNKPFTITQGPGNVGWTTTDVKCEP